MPRHTKKVPTEELVRVFSDRLSGSLWRNSIDGRRWWLVIPRKELQPEQSVRELCVATRLSMAELAFARGNMWDFDSRFISLVVATLRNYIQDGRSVDDRPTFLTGKPGGFQRSCPRCFAGAGRIPAWCVIRRLAQDAYEVSLGVSLVCP